MVQNVPDEYDHPQHQIPEDEDMGKSSCPLQLAQTPHHLPPTSSLSRDDQTVILHRQGSVRSQRSSRADPKPFPFTQEHRRSQMTMPNQPTLQGLLTNPLACPSIQWIPSQAYTPLRTVIQAVILKNTTPTGDTISLESLSQESQDLYQDLANLRIQGEWNKAVASHQVQEVWDKVKQLREEIEDHRAHKLANIRHQMQQQYQNDQAQHQIIQG